MSLHKIKILNLDQELFFIHDIDLFFQSTVNTAVHASEKYSDSPKIYRIKIRRCETRQINIKKLVSTLICVSRFQYRSRKGGNQFRVSWSPMETRTIKYQKVSISLFHTFSILKHHTFNNQHSVFHEIRTLQKLATTTDTETTSKRSENIIKLLHTFSDHREAYLVFEDPGGSLMKICERLKRDEPQILQLFNLFREQRFFTGKLETRSRGLFSVSLQKNNRNLTKFTTFMN